MNQAEREYREAMDGLQFSNEEKERIMKNLVETEKQSGKGKRIPVRTALIAVALCAALLGTAGAVNVIARQTRTHFLNSKDEVQNVIENALENSGGDSDAPQAVAIGGGFNGEYDYTSTADETEDWWNAYGLAPLEEVAGTEEDGWTRMRKFQREGFLEMRYLAEKLSGFDSLWADASWDTTWLEEHYFSVSNGQIGCIKIDRGKTVEFSLRGEFQGTDGAAFTVEFSKGDRPYGDSEYQMTTGYDHTEIYQTLDGVEVSIKMGTSNSGKSVFWADFTAGYNYFGMWGTELELDNLHDILDSLNLSVLLEYTPEQ